MHTTDLRVNRQCRGRFDPGRTAVRRGLVGLAWIATLLAVWSLTHRYRALGGDAELYAVQALSRLQPGLAHDLFLQNVSQDRYTLFSPFYAACIALLGLRPAALLLTVVFKAWFYAAAWWFARSLSDRNTAFLSTALLIVTAGTYGAFDVFHYAEDWVTARSPAEAMAVTALALHAAGRRGWGLALCAAALVVHPLMALPALLVLACLWVSPAAALAGAGAGLLLTLGLGLAALTPWGSVRLGVIDADWLEVVRERSRFLLLQYWSWNDWKTNIGPFLSLGVSAMALADPRVLKLCRAVMLVGAAGLAVALIASLLGPVAVLLQGQAWRWPWVTRFLAVLLVAPTALRMWRDPACGPLCALLLVASWTFPSCGGDIGLVVSGALWWMRSRFTPRLCQYARWGAALCGAALLVWIGTHLAPAAHGPAPDDGGASTLARMHDIVGPGGAWMVLVGCIAFCIRSSRSNVVAGGIALALFGVSAWALPGTFADPRREGNADQRAEFSEWRSLIPPQANVFVAPAHNSAAFAWFTLERPSYLSVDQSAGVVFSRATALEVRRRSEVLLPLMNPDWRLLSDSRRRLAAGGGDGAAAEAASAGGGALPPRPLTADRLTRICRDPRLAFVVARVDVGFGALGHAHDGDWKDWYLYDCRRVLGGLPPA